ncbi:MAG TPA: DUF6457 domain-containing protein [Mycobacteriales bacterium]|nr:DUF6457 domain-containing protein [Mycobacteriales bacterium]
MTLDEWVRVVCAELELEPPDVREVLDFAREVAHRVDRPAAPLTCLLVGLAARGAHELPVVIDRLRALLPPEEDQPTSPSR